MATLVINIGNSSLFCGVFAGARAAKVFRLPIDAAVRLPARVRGRIERAAVSSVVPALTPEVLRLIRRTWAVEPAVLTATAAHGLKIGYRVPAQLGADRVAAALGARTLYPRRHVIVVDCGTATTVTA
ncbi:MAG TPA: type III pantothenate kinase, partial [Opitutus sp.]|nr:type III pantothenate kinase [Opitutus sp.]